MPESGKGQKSYAANWPKPDPNILFWTHLGICFCPPNESNIYLPLAVFALLTPQKKFWILDQIAGVL